MVTGALTWHLIYAKSSQADGKLGADLKTLVDSAANTVRDAERKTVGLAISHVRKGDPFAALRSATETLRSSSFEAAVSDARSRWRLPLLAS
jgi:hypothetical protein